MFPVDIDPKRPAGISASDTELAIAARKAKEMTAFLESFDVPIVKAQSGNGYHILIFLQPLTCDEDSTLAFKHIGDLIASRFQTDTTIYNPARIWKLYGTVARKGDDTAERPHRRAKIQLPDEIIRIPFAALEAKIRAELETTTAPSAPSGTTETHTPGPQHTQRKHTDITLREWLDRHQIPYTEKPYKGTFKYQVDCPHNQSHKKPDAWVTDEGGTWQFSCSHNSCKGERATWNAFKEAHGIKNHPNLKKKFPGRPSKVEQVASVTIPETLLEKPIVMLQELVELDGKTIIAERSRDVVSDDVAKHLWRNGKPTQLFRRGQDLGTLRPAENGLLFFPSDKDSLAGDIARCVSLVKFGHQGNVTPIATPLSGSQPIFCETSLSTTYRRSK